MRFSEVDQLGTLILNASRSAKAIGGVASEVDGARLGQVVDLAAHLQRAPAPIDFFEVKEVIFIEKPKRGQNRTAHAKTRAQNTFDKFAMLVERLSAKAIRKDQSENEERQNLLGKGWKRRECALQTPVGIAELAACDCQLRKRIEPVRKSAQRAGFQLSIVVEQQDEFRRSSPNSLIHCVCEPAIAVVPNHLNARNVCLNILNGIVCAAVVHDDDLAWRNVLMHSRKHAFEQQVSAVIVHDYHGEPSADVA